MRHAVDLPAFVMGVLKCDNSISHVCSAGSGLSVRSGNLEPMDRPFELQDGIALAGITTAHSAGQAVAAIEPSGPVATGALSIIDAAAGLADLAAVTALTSRASGLLTRAETLGVAAMTAVASAVAVDETNALLLSAVAADI